MQFIRTLLRKGKPPLRETSDTSDDRESAAAQSRAPRPKGELPRRKSRLSRAAFFLGIVLLCASAACAGASVVQRTPLGTYALEGPKAVSRVEVKRLAVPPGFKFGPHTHPGPVVCYVTEGRLLVQTKGDSPRSYTAGQTILEPANTPIERFENDSSSASATFIATYLLGDQDTELIHMLQ